MQKLATRLSLVCFAAIATLSSCEKVSTLNDSANITQIAITASEPSKAVFRDPVVKGNVIELPLVYGKYLFPITVSFDVKTEKGCVQLLGFDKNTSFTFDNMNHVRDLFTVATSGATTRWKLQIVDAMSSESAEIVQARASAPEGSTTLVAPVARVDLFDATVTFQGTGDDSYPLTVIPDITLAEGSRFTAELPKQITFENAEDTKEYTVEAASGRTKSWTFRSDFVLSKDNSTASNMSDDQVRRLTVNAADVTLTSEQARLAGSNATFSVSTTGGVLDLILAPTGSESLTFPLRATVNIPVSAQSELFGAPEANKFEFTGYADKKQVWVADRLSGMIKCWTVAISPELNTNIKTYTVTSFTCAALPTLTVDKENIVIDNEKSMIVVPVDNGLGTAIEPTFKMTLRLNIALGLYDGSKSSTTYTSHTYITNTGSISVNTENGLEKRSWTVFLKDKNAALSAEKDLMNLAIVGYTSQGNRMTLSTSSYTANNTTNTITLTVSGGVDAFPLVITKKSLRTKHHATRIFPSTIADFDAPLVFESLQSVKEFTAQAEDGSTKEWIINLTSTATGKTAEITDLLVTKASNGAIPSEVQIDAANRHVKLIVDGLPPFHFTTQITTSDKATVSGLENGILSFASYAQQVPLKVTSQDGSVTNTWTVGIEQPAKVQIANSDFELWGEFKDVNGGTYTINPTPGAGYGWGTANLKIFGIGVMGTMPVERTDGTKAAEMTTSEQNTILKGYIVAAGTLYTGIFNLNMDYITEPRKMTKFGIPYSARPTSFDMEVKYAPGSQLKQATIGSNGKYAIQNIDGVDKGHIWVELVDWKGEGPIDYDGNASDKLDVIGRAELVIDGANNPYQEWTKINLPMVYNQQFANSRPTHIVVVMSSSKDGDRFIGAFGSKLSADHFVINY